MKIKSDKRNGRMVERRGERGNGKTYVVEVYEDVCLVDVKKAKDLTHARRIQRSLPNFQLGLVTCSEAA